MRRPLLTRDDLLVLGVAAVLVTVLVLAQGADLRSTTNVLGVAVFALLVWRLTTPLWRALRGHAVAEERAVGDDDGGSSSTVNSHGEFLNLIGVLWPRAKTLHNSKCGRVGADAATAPPAATTSAPRPTAARSAGRSPLSLR